MNAAKSRYFELVLGDGQPFELIGVDGGHMEYSLKRWTIVLGPGERADVLVAPRLDGRSADARSPILSIAGSAAPNTARRKT